MAGMYASQWCWHGKRSGLRFIYCTQWLILVAVEIIVLSAPASAEELILDGWWLNVGGPTYHINNKKHRNGETYGLGVEYKLSATESIRGGVFRNSFERNAPYIAYAWLPLQWGTFQLGGNAVAAGGYSHNRTGTMAAIIPWAEITWKYAGLELGVVPVKNGIVTARFKFRF